VRTIDIIRLRTSSLIIVLIEAILTQHDGNMLHVIKFCPMAVPRVFWMSTSGALLIVAASASYFMLVILPNSQRHKDELIAEIASKQAAEKQILDCVEQARRAGQDMAKYSSGFGSPSNVSGVSNHYNRKLNKCIVDVQTVDKNGTAEFVMDAYEQSSVLWCTTRFMPKGTPPIQRTCMDSKNNRLDAAEADKQIDVLMRE